jgi:ring-1,2-phenylacetyl-CoA epoxidase subunit PaaD
MTEQLVMEALTEVYDPEIPNLSVLDLGMITGVVVSGNQINVDMIPTYAACPATSFLQKIIKEQLVEKFPNAEIIIQVITSIHWDTNRITENGKLKLKEARIAPPPVHKGEVTREMLLGVTCPQCSGVNTFLQIPFGYTLCRAIHFCKDCNASFEQFKPVALS